MTEVYAPIPPGKRSRVRYRLIHWAGKFAVRSTSEHEQANDCRRELNHLPKGTRYVIQRLQIHDAAEGFIGGKETKRW